QSRRMSVRAKRTRERQAGWHRRSNDRFCPSSEARDRGVFLLSRNRFVKGETTMSENKIPYKIYLSEDEMPKAWYNLRADMKNKPAPLLNPATLQPMTAQELEGVFCSELVKQELDDTTPFFEI